MKKRNVNSGQALRHPNWVRAVNTLWPAAYALGGRRELDFDELIRSARKGSGLQDLGSDFREEPLRRMIQALNQEADLHPLGRFISRQRIINLLKVRLRAENWFKKIPAILEQPLYPLTVIVGLQRTGTTKLQRLLNADPDNRTLASWEAVNPAPMRDDINATADRIRVARTSENALKILSPDFFAIHPVEHLAPEEDVLLLDASFLSTTIEATAHVPSYAAWLETVDQTPAYEYAARLLKLLQWQRPARYWVLKTPHHLEFLPVIERVFGKETRFVWTHRPAEESIPSFMNMVAHARMIFSRTVSKEEVGKHWLRKTAYMLDCAMNYRLQSANDARFTDIWFRDFVKNPMPSLKAVYAARQQEVTPFLEQRFREAEDENPAGKYGLHEYRLEDFGLTQEDLDRATERYRNWQHQLFDTHKSLSFAEAR